MCALGTAARAVLILFLFLGVFVAGCKDKSGSSTPWGTLGKAKVIYVVTTEDPADLEPYRVRCGAGRFEIVPFSMISVRIREIGKNPIIFLINRGKRMRVSPEDENLLPYATEAIKPNAVFTYMSKDKKRDPRREGALDILISAPSNKWLFKALDEFIESDSVPNPPQISEIKSVVVVSTDGPDMAKRWVRPIEGSTDWEFIDAGKLDPSASFEGFDEIYLLNRDMLASPPDHLISRLPKDVREQIAGGLPITEMLAQREQKIEGDRHGWRAAIIAPSREFLERQISRYDRLERIPESVSRHSLLDLSGFTSIAVVARSADRDRNDLVPYLDEIASKATSALTSGTRFRCANRQDMKEAIYEALHSGQRVELDSARAEDLGAAVHSHLLCVIDLLDVSTVSTFKAEDPEQVTSSYGPYSEPEPSRPRRPELGDRRYGIFGPKKYNGYNDPKYRADMHEWEEDMDDWARAHRVWESRRYHHEQRRLAHDIEWKIACSVTESATVNANVRFYSLEQGPGYAPGMVVYSCSISGACEKTRLHKEDRVVVRGEGQKPGNVIVPPSDTYISDRSIIAEAISRSVGKFSTDLHSSAILPGELANWKPALAMNESREKPKVDVVKVIPANDAPLKPEPVVVEYKADQAYEFTGSVRCAKEPKAGAELESAKKRAYESACKKALTAVLMDDPDADVELADVMRKAKVLSSGYDAASGEYRVKIKFSPKDKEVAKGGPTDEVV